MAGVDLLDGVTLTRDVVTSIEFDNISQSYNHLWILGTWANGSHYHWGSSMAMDIELFAPHPNQGDDHHEFGPLHRVCVYKPQGQGSTSGGGSTSDSVAITKIKFSPYSGSFMHGTSIMLYGME